MEQQQFTADISDYIAALKRRRMLLAFVALPIAVLTTALALGLPDQYLSKALISFENAPVSGSLPTDKPTHEKAYYDQYVSNLTDAVLDSRSLKKRIGLPGAPKRLEGEAMEDYLARIADNTKVDTVRESVLDPDSGRQREIISAFTVGYLSRDPKESQDAARWLTEAFLDESRNNLKQRALSSATFYTAEGERYSKQIADLEARLADFKAKNFGQLPELTDVNLNVMDRVERDLDNIESQLSQLRQNKIFLAQQLDQARNTSPDVTLLNQLEAEYAQKSAIYDPDHPDLINLRRQLESLRRGGPAIEDMSLPQQLEAQQAILAETRQRYSEDHPDVKRIERTIANLKERIARGEKADSTLRPTQTVVQLQTQMNGIDTQIAALTARGNELRAKLAQLEKRVEMTPMVEREYQSLTRDLQLARNKYDELLKSRMDAELTAAAIAGGRSDELRIVQPAPMPVDPAKPKRAIIAAGGIILAFLFALAAVVIAEAMDQTVRGSRDVRRVLAVSPLAVIPEILDASAIRRQRLKVGLLAACTVFGSVIVVMTLRSFMT
ncbi:MAG TPA: GNVR domain-containing protein [Steroidobacteraceae bacterium]|jgi:succinoglycan biosynthesis transport protein ExoP|nr:GNVR domain-containing protein [Steroidobacteraceae bacterium]